MCGIKIEFALKMQGGGLMHEGGRICGTLWYLYYYRFVYLCEHSHCTAEAWGRLIPAWVRMVWRVLLSPPFLRSLHILSNWKACSSGWWKCMRHCTTSLVLRPRNRASRLQWTVCFATCWPTSRRKRSVTGWSVEKEWLLTFETLVQVGYI